LSALSALRFEERFEPLSTRLFPKQCGVDGFRITGLAARCDWVVLSSHIGNPKVKLVKQNDDQPPRSIFISLRNRAALPFWGEEILPGLEQPVVLISGSEDITIPNQIDKRWASYGPDIRAVIQDTLDSPLVSAWFCENLDEALSHKMHPIPLGLVFPEGPPEQGVAAPQWLDFDARIFRMFCAHRIREGAQWEPRRLVSDLAAGPWSKFATPFFGEISEAVFEDLLRRYAFVACVEGGGLDPSPKAWQAIMNGCIPVIRRTALAPAYEELPVLFVEDWTADALGPALLGEGCALWRRWFGERRSEVIHRLSIDYWWDKVQTKIDGSG